MITINTKKEIEIRNATYEVIDSKVVTLSVQNITQDRNVVTANGFYYYTNNDGDAVKLKDNRTYMSWDQIEEIEFNSLQPMTDVNYKEANFERLKEFVVLKLTEESGKNFGILIEDWDI
jgi:phage gp45-like